MLMAFFKGMLQAGRGYASDLFGELSGELRSEFEEPWKNYKTGVTSELRSLWSYRSHPELVSSSTELVIDSVEKKKDYAKPGILLEGEATGVIGSYSRRRLVLEHVLREIKELGEDTEILAAYCDSGEKRTRSNDYDCGGGFNLHCTIGDPKRLLLGRLDYQVTVEVEARDGSGTVGNFSMTYRSGPFDGIFDLSLSNAVRQFAHGMTMNGNVLDSSRLFVSLQAGNDIDQQTPEKSYVLRCGLKEPKKRIFQRGRDRQRKVEEGASTNDEIDWNEPLL